MKTLKSIEHAQIEFFILIIRVSHVSSIHIIIRAIWTLWETEIIVYMKICSTHLKLKKRLTCDFGRILETECNLQHFTRNWRIKNLDEFEIDEADAYLWTVGLLNVKEKGMTIRYIINRCLVIFLRGEKSNLVQCWRNIVAKLKVNNWSLSKWLSN